MIIEELLSLTPLDRSDPVKLDQAYKDLAAVLDQVFNNEEKRRIALSAHTGETLELSRPGASFTFVGVPATGRLKVRVWFSKTRQGKYYKTLVTRHELVYPPDSQEFRLQTVDPHVRIEYENSMLVLRIPRSLVITQYEVKQSWKRKAGEDRD